MIPGINFSGIAASTTGGAIFGGIRHFIHRGHRNKSLIWPSVLLVTLLPVGLFNFSRGIGRQKIDKPQSKIVFDRDKVAALET